MDIDPFLTGNGSGNPNFVVARQLLSDNGFTQEFLKDQWGNKPVITQSLDSGTFHQDTVIDMSNSTYSDMTIAGNVTITSIFDDPFENSVAGFNSATDVKPGRMKVTAGKYSYVPGLTVDTWYLNIYGTNYLSNDPNEPLSCIHPEYRDQVVAVNEEVVATNGLPPGTVVIECVSIAVSKNDTHNGTYTYASGYGYDPVNESINWMDWRDPAQNPFAADKRDAFPCPPTTDPSIYYYTWCPQPTP